MTIVQWTRGMPLGFAVMFSLLERQEALGEVKRDGVRTQRRLLQLRQQPVLGEERDVASAAGSTWAQQQQPWWMAQQAPPMPLKKHTQQTFILPSGAPSVTSSFNFIPTPTTSTLVAAPLLAGGTASGVQGGRMGRYVNDGGRTETMKNHAIVVADPKAPSPLNSFAAGKGIEEAVVGQTAHFHIVARDMYGDAQRCQPDSFVVNVVHVRADWDDTRTRCSDSESSRCTRCGATSVCYKGVTDGGACAFTFTPQSAGALQIRILTPSQTGEGLTNIQGSPFELHVDDGALFLPGVSIGGYLEFCLVSILGAVAVVCAMMSGACAQHKSSLRRDEYQEEVGRMEELAARLSSTAQRREDNNYLLAQLPVLLQEEDMETDSDDDNNLISMGKTSPQTSLPKEGMSISSKYRRRQASVDKGGEYLSEVVSRGIHGIAEFATPVRAMHQLLVDDDDTDAHATDTAIEMQGFGKAEGGSGGRFLEYTDEASSFDGF